MADSKGTITKGPRSGVKKRGDDEDLKNTIALGQTIYDNAGEKVGTVDDLDRPTGWLKSEINPFSDAALYIPFNMITNIDPKGPRSGVEKRGDDMELYLSRSKEELRRDYTTPPARTTQVDKVAGETVATTWEPSGYDGTPLIVAEAKLDKLRDRITVGDLVLTADMVDLGTIKRYDATTGWMMIGKSLQARNDLLVPITLVSHVDGDVHEVYLAASRADLRGMQHLEPADVVFVDSKPLVAS